MEDQLELYLIASRRNRYLLFVPSDVMERCEAESGDAVRKGIRWVASRRNRVVRWLGRVLDVAHGYYVKLEDKLDPVERVIKSIAGAKAVTVFYAPALSEAQARSRFLAVLRRQRMKHGFWLVVDGVICPFTLMLAPVPGPNVVGYYPLLRFLSHYRAVRGATKGLGSVPVCFKSLPELSALEENLHAPRFDRESLAHFVEPLKIQGLGQFLERMV